MQITQIVRILNSHLTQLQTIDQGTVALQEKIAKAQKNAQGLGHANNGGTGAGNGAVEDFYRSYMGRR
jgi:nuclear pore complex protein Nup62